MIKGNLLYGQSGGPTSIINVSAYYLFKNAFKCKKIDKIYSMHYGIEGLLKEDLILLNKKDKNLKKLLNTPGAFFGSNRFKLEKEDINTLEKIYLIFKKYNIRYFFYNGGNDSMDTINKIAQYLKSKNYECYSIGIIKTVDNDLALTDFSLGYVSASLYIINSLLQIYNDDRSYRVGRVNIVEVMGRNAGWLAASSKLLERRGIKADLICVPENPFCIEEFLSKVDKIYKKKKHCLVVVSEGIKDKGGKNLFEYNSLIDDFNHVQLGGVAANLAEIINEKLNIKTRYFELSTLQRANSIYKAKKEVEIAKKLSKFALISALNKEDNKAVIIKRSNDKKIEFNFDLVDIKDIANIEKLLPFKYIDKENNYINDEFLSYLNPLIDDKEILDFYK